MSLHGWSVCTVPAVAQPAAPEGNTNRFHTAGVYNKFHLWEMVGYEGVLYLDSDTMVVQNLMPLFDVYYPMMVRTGVGLAAATENLTPPLCPNPSYPGVDTPFNAGVLLVQPNATETKLLLEILHKRGLQKWAEQSILNERFSSAGNTHVELPFAYNANVCEARCNYPRWHSEPKVIVHFTCSKPWNDINLNNALAAPYVKLWRNLAPFVAEG